MVCRMTSAFCCLKTDLRTGSLVAGWFYLVGSIIYLIIGIVNFRLFYDFSESSNLLTSDEKEQLDLVATTIYVIFFVTIGIIFAVCGCLIYGVTKGRRGFLIPYLIVFGLGICLTLFEMISSLVSGGMSAKLLIHEIMVMAITIYFVAIVRSHYSELDPANQGPKNSVEFATVPV